MFAAIENGIVVGLSETDLTNYTSLLVVPCDNTVSVGDLYDGDVFTQGPPEPEPPPDNEELDSRLIALETSVNGGDF
jgi:hypothetical protein